MGVLHIHPKIPMSADEARRRAEDLIDGGYYQGDLSYEELAKKIFDAEVAREAEEKKREIDLEVDNPFRKE